MPSWMSLGFQDPSSYVMSEFVKLHDYVMVIMLSVIFLISYILIFLLFFSNSFYYKFLSEGTFIETVWSMVPAFLLILLVYPSMMVLYLMEEVKQPFTSVKILAFQWYWVYEYFYSVGLNSTFYSFMGFPVDCNFLWNEFEGEEAMSPPLLMSEEFLPLLVDKVYRFYVSSMDVIHSFAVPSLGLKVDALPGRINQIHVLPIRVGSFYGQCSEICGTNHSFMPIKVKVFEDF